MQLASSNGTRVWSILFMGGNELTNLVAKLLNSNTLQPSYINYFPCFCDLIVECVGAKPKHIFPTMQFSYFIMLFT